MIFELKNELGVHNALRDSVLGLLRENREFEGEWTVGGFYRKYNVKRICVSVNKCKQKAITILCVRSFINAYVYMRNVRKNISYYN